MPQDSAETFTQHFDKDRQSMSIMFARVTLVIPFLGFTSKSVELWFQTS
jgi:hypothetical protein